MRHSILRHFWLHDGFELNNPTILRFNAFGALRNATNIIGVACYSLASQIRFSAWMVSILAFKYHLTHFISSQASFPAYSTSTAILHVKTMSAVVRIRNVTVGDNRSTTSCTRNPISAGEAAGIGIGGVVVGALLSCLTICIFMARSKRHRRREGDLSGVGKNVGVPIVAPVETFLDRADDSQLRKSMQNLDEIIDQHVENHYHLQAFGGSRGSLERCLVECGYNIEPSVPEMVALLVNPRTRFAGIRQVIGMILLGNVDCRSRAELSLLPPQIVGFCQSIPPVERQPGSDEGKKATHLAPFATFC